MRSGSSHQVRRWFRLVTGAAALLAAPLAAQAQGTSITGRVTDQASGAPLGDARVYLLGSALVTATNAEGRYTLRGVPAGTGEVRTIRVGYTEQKKPVTVTAGGTTTVDFALEPSIVKLAEVVTTATGQQRRVELGNTVATLGDVSARVEETPVSNISDLLVAKMPGVVVLPGATTGTAGTVRIRGTSSLSLSNAPIWIVDGVRFNASNFSANGAGGTMGNSTFLNGLNPEDIQDVEVVKGPSAATLYGTDASNGVIVVTTKKGRAGAARWSTFAEYGRVEDHSQYPETFAIWGHRPAAPNTPVRCLLRELPLNTCVRDSVTSLNIIEVPSLSPLSTGDHKQFGMQVSGGTESVRYFVSGDFQDDVGPLKLPDVDATRLQAARLNIRDEWERPEAMRSQSARANIGANPHPTLDLNVSAGFSKINQRLGQLDNNFNSVFYQSMMSPGFRGPGLGYTAKDSRGQDLNGNAQYTYGDIFQRNAREDVQRLVGSTLASWRPVSWLQTDGTVGLDLAARSSFGLCRFGECPDFNDWRRGQVADAHFLNRNFSFKLTSTASWQPLAWLDLKTTAGADYTNQQREDTRSTGTVLPPGAQGVSDAAVTTGNATLPSADKTFGVYLQEQAAFRDRLFVTLAVRSDENSAFGTNFQRVFYPKGSVSWIMSEEPFFPKLSFLNQFRLRSAYGASGVQPQSTSAFVTYTAPTVSVGGSDLPGLRENSLGNPNLKPETSTEWEGGFDGRFLKDRVSVEFTYYHKKTKDALLNLNIAPSAASSATTVLRNQGSVENKGLELSINSTILDLRRVAWDVTINASRNTNKLLSLGRDGRDSVIRVNGTGANRDSVGFPLRGWYYRTYAYDDANNDGIIVADEVMVNPNFSYQGSSIPRNILSITNGVSLFNRTLRLNAMFDYKGGFKIANSGKSFQCGNNPACPGLSNPDAAVEDQAAAVAFTAKAPLNTSWGFLEKGDFVRFRELSATYTLPASISRHARARDATLSLGARNLKVWTDYKGADPEEGFVNGNVTDVQATFASSAPRRFYTFRLNLHY